MATMDVPKLKKRKKKKSNTFKMNSKDKLNLDEAEQVVDSNAAMSKVNMFFIMQKVFHK